MNNKISLKYVAFGNSYDDLIPYEYHHQQVKSKLYKISDYIADSMWSVHKQDIKVDQMSFNVDVDTIRVEIIFTREFDDAEFEEASTDLLIESFILTANDENYETEIEFTLDEFTK